MADYLAANLRAPILKAFQDHMNTCGDCRAFLKTYKKTVELIPTILQKPGRKSTPRRLGPLPFVNAHCLH